MLMCAVAVATTAAIGAAVTVEIIAEITVGKETTGRFHHVRRNHVRFCRINHYSSHSPSSLCLCYQALTFHSFASCLDSNVNSDDDNNMEMVDDDGRGVSLTANPLSMVGGAISLVT
jgi:hypothetical protein